MKKKFTTSEKFLIFYEYLLNTNKENENLYNYLIEDYLEEINKREENEKIDVKVLISILFHPMHNQKITSFICEKIKERDIIILNEINKKNAITSNNNYYLEKIESYLNSLDANFQN